MICLQCQKVGQKLSEIMGPQERLYVLTSAVSMMKYVMANANAPEQDKVVGSSITTKVLLSFPGPQRQTLIEQLRKSAGMDIELKDCPHTQLVV